MASQSLPWGWTAYFTELGRFITSSERYYGTTNAEYTEYALHRFTLNYQHVMALKEQLENIPALQFLHSQIAELGNKLSSMLMGWQHYADTLDDVVAASHYTPPRASSGSGLGGRPRFVATRDQLLYLRSLSFSWTQIASLLGVFRMTIYRRWVEYGLVSEPLQLLDKTHLLTLVRDLRRELLQIGESMVSGRIRSMGYRVARDRVR